MEMVYLVNFPSKNATKGQEFNGAPELEKELLERGIIGNGEITIEKDNSNSNELLEIIDNLKKDLEEKNDFISNSEIPELKALVEEKIAEVNEKDKAIEGLTKESEDLKVLNENQTLDINEKNEGIAALMVVIEELKSLVEEAIALPKGQIPEGFVKYKES